MDLACACAVVRVRALCASREYLRISRTRFELFYTKRSLFRFHERFAKVVGTFCLFPETEVKPLDELRIDDDATDSYQDEEERGHNRSQHSGASARSFADLVDASLVAVDHQGHVRRSHPCHLDTNA
jgi:hypothetical protein